MQQTTALSSRPLRVLYSFPHKLGAGRICTTAWEQVKGVAAAGAHVQVFAGAVARPLPETDNITTRTTLAWGKVRVPYKVVGDMRACALHDYIVSRRLTDMAKDIDIVHAWPLGALQTLETAARLGIPSVLERPNAHTEYAYEVVQMECERLGVTLPAGHEHAYNQQVLAKEEREYQLATKLLCPSEFVARTFVDRGFSPKRLARHQYGYDEGVFYPPQSRARSSDLTMLFVGGCAPRKGLHYALQAWLDSSACRGGKFLIAGEFIPSYAEKLAPMLAHPSVHALGHRRDVGELMRASDILVLPSIEEGSALVTAEARGSGCILLVSDAAGAVCAHMGNSLVHEVGDVKALTDHINLLQNDPQLREKLRAESLRTVENLTWRTAGAKLFDVYKQILCDRDGISSEGNERDSELAAVQR